MRSRAAASRRAARCGRGRRDLAGTMEPADDVTKLHTTAFTRSVTQRRDAGSCGRTAGPWWSGRAGRAAGSPAADGRGAGPPADGWDRRRTGRCWMPRWRAGADGIVVAATGAGNTRRAAGRRRTGDGRGRGGRAGVALPGGRCLDRRTRSRAAARRGSAPARSGSGTCARSRRGSRWRSGWEPACRDGLAGLLADRPTASEPVPPEPPDR